MTGHSCLGLTADALCKYDPASPALSYFGIGEAVAALALTLGVRSFLKPVYRFRLSVRGIELQHILILCFAGFAAVLIATILPMLPVTRNLLFTFPVFWEILGGMLFFSAYIILAFGSAVPVKVKKNGFERFARSLAEFLSEQSRTEYATVADEILLNLPELIREASFNEQRWSQRSAFYEFTHRKKIRDAAYAGSLISILSDPVVCKTLVESTPWRLAAMLNTLSNQKLHTRSGERFIQQLATQAIFSENSAMRREVGFDGFASVRAFTDSFFGSAFICRLYRPLNMLSFPEKFDPKSMDCLGLAMETMFSSAMSDGHHWEASHIYDLEGVVQSVFWNIPTDTNGKVENFRYYFAVTHGIKDIILYCRKFLSQHERVENFYSTNAEHDSYHYANQHVVNAVAKIVLQFFQSIANDFEGGEDQYWSSVNQIWKSCFPSIGTYPDGVDPLQQHLAIMLHEEISSNIKGYYPAISRIMLSVIGPYNSMYPKNRKSAAGLIEKDFYNKFRNFHLVRESHYMKKEALLPSFISFSEDDKTLKFSHASGNTVVSLARMRPPKIDWTDASNWSRK